MADDGIEAQITAACEMISRAAASLPDLPKMELPAGVVAIPTAPWFSPASKPIEVTYVARCRVYWGSHGCQHPCGHGPEIPHECSCCECETQPCAGACVARPPYYGPKTLFYGEDAEALGLPGANDG